MLAQNGLMKDFQAQAVQFCSLRTPLTAVMLVMAMVLIASTGQAQFTQPQALLQRPQGEIRVLLELARSPQEMQRGLMFRKELDENAGMLFIYEKDGDHHFWMKNTYLPLDMLFISADGQVLGIVENAEPLSLESLSVGVPSRYVLELNAGYCRRHAIHVGSKMRFLGLGEFSGAKH